LLDRVPLLVAAEKIHPAVDAGGVGAQRLVDQAHALDELAPVDFRAQPQAGDRIGDRDLRHPCR
jgi:hypothetical protein